MATNDAATLELERELAAEPEDASAAASRAERLDIHTALPGIVVSFDPATQTAKVQPAIKRRWIDAGFLPLPELVNCPVQFPRGGNFVITFPVRANDPCLVHFSERAIDNWWHEGGVQEPSEFRLHDLSDGFAALGYAPIPDAAQVVGGAAGDALEIRTLDGTTVLRIENNLVYIGARLGAEPTYKGTSNAALLATLLGAFVVYLPIIQGIADPTGTATTTLLTAISTFLTGQGATLTAKARVF